VDPDLVRAIIRQESVFNPNARSPAGAMGLMQLMPATARLESKRLSKSYLPNAKRKSLRAKARRKANLLVPDTNIALGVHHVRHLLKLYESPVFALSAYNASPSAARRWKKSLSTVDLMAFIERIPYKETRAYVKLVLRNYFYYKRWYTGSAQSLAHLDQVAPLEILKSNELPLATPVKDDDTH
jgi:soluble lytic murein transglycosylase